MQTPCRRLPRSGALTVAAASRRERHFKKLTLKIYSLVLNALSFSSSHQNSPGLVIFIFVAFKEPGLLLDWKVLSLVRKGFFFLVVFPFLRIMKKRAEKMSALPLQHGFFHLNPHQNHQSSRA